MIIKSVFRRYKGWIPVHPTYGAFWGMGVGIGCGVGWGPGFGPEVIGYVGSGCGVGFSVGVTLFGLGIGIPANYPFKALHTVPDALKLARARDLLGKRSRDGAEIVKLPDMKHMLVSPVEHITSCLQRLGGQFFPWDNSMHK